MQPHGSAIVTGASRGLGRAIALELADRGFDVVAGVRDLDGGSGLAEEAANRAGSLRVQQLDVTRLADFQPPPDLRVLVNNAGYRGPYLPIEEAPPEEWRKTFETNVFGPIELIRRCVPILRTAGEGVICNIGSFAVEMPTPFFSTYRASKAAMLAVGQSIRVELAPFNIRVIDVPIAGVDTDMMRTSMSWRPPDAVQYEPYRPMAERIMEVTALGRTAAVSPAEAARNVVDAILVDDGPLTRPCDPNAVKLSGDLGGLSEEERYRAMTTALGLPAQADVR